MSKRQNRVSSVLVKPVSADCNLRCTYCFYLPKLDLYPETNIHRMSDELTAPNSPFSWQGGEPTVAGLDFFRKVVDLQQKYGRSGAVVANSLQTNATLIHEEWARFMAEYNFLVGVSLDGPKDIHDHYRLTIDGRPTFDMVMQAIERLKRHKVEFNILVLLNRLNSEQPERVWDFMAEHGLGFLQFIPCVERDPSTGEPAEYAVRPDQFGKFLCAVFDRWYNDGEPTVYVRDFEDFLFAAVRGEAPSCIYARRCGSYVVVEHNGDVYCCDFYVDPDWRLGNLLETPLAELVESDLLARFALRKAEMHPQCRQCPWLKLCRGACPKDRMTFSDDHRALNYLCPGYQMLFEHAHERIEKLRAKVLERERQQQAEAPAIQSRRDTAARPRVGRNAPCPCGSGRKFKVCCGR